MCLEISKTVFSVAVGWEFARKVLSVIPRNYSDSILRTDVLQIRRGWGSELNIKKAEPGVGLESPGPSVGVAL
jgi:hypothetical protein